MRPLKISSILFKVILIIGGYLITPRTAAHDEAVDPSLNETEFRTLKKIDLGAGKTAYVIVRRDGHVLGQDFQVELRVDCKYKEQTKIIDLPVVDSFSTCDLSPESIKLNLKKTAIALKVKNADIQSYSKQIAQGVISPEIKCAKPTRIKKFSLVNLCDHKE